MADPHPSESARRLPPISLAWLTWGLLASLYFVGYFQRVAPAVMVDELMHDFGVAATLLGNLSAIYFYTYAAMQIPSGLLADAVGPRFSAGGLIIGFAFSREVNHPGAAGTVGGVVNMAVLGFAAIQQSAMGWILDHNWQGAMSEGARIYDAAACHAALLWLAISAVGAVVFVALTHETHCRLRFDADD